MLNDKKFTLDDDVQDALSAKQYWRAKEITRGRITISYFEPRFLFAHGFVLMQMGDTKEAGRFLFASGVRGAEYHNAIELFLSCFSDNPSKETLWHAMPRMLRKCGHVAKKIVNSPQFIDQGYSDQQYSQLKAAFKTNPNRNIPDQETRFGNFVATVLVSIIIVCFVTGIFTVGSFIFRFVGKLFDG